MLEILHRRADGSFVIRHPGTGYPYHVTPFDPLYEQAFAEAMGRELPPEPPPRQVPPSRRIAPRDFLDRISEATQRDLFILAVMDATLLRWLWRLAAAREVDLDAADTVDAVAALLGRGVISTKEARALLA